MLSRRAAEAILVLSLSAAVAVLLTYPLAFKLGHAGRIEVDDGRWSIWVIAWVARTLVADPRHLFDANIFYPHRNTLAYSEINLGGGLLGVPIYWLTLNPYATHNFVVLTSFVLSAVGMYYLCRHLTGHRGAAAVAAVTFAFSPYVFGRTPHIQLLLIAGFPFSMLAFHRLLDRPSLGRALALPPLLLLQAVSCGYYGVFAALMVSGGVLFFAVTRDLWRDAPFWRMVITAGVLSLVGGFLVYLPYLQLREETGFGRSLEDARVFSANWQSYFVSNAWAHSWMLPWIHGWKDVLFPGFVAVTFGLAGIGLAARRALTFQRDTMLFYAMLGISAFWASFGPAAGLYTLLYDVVPVFSLMRVPTRFAVLVTFSFSVLTAFTVARLLQGRARGSWIAAALTIIAIAELASIPMDWRDAPSLPGPYHVLARLPRGPVVELPFFYRRQDFPRHSIYMLNSTYHWQPLVNGYSDYIPPDFRDMVLTVSSFPTREAFKRLEPIAPRYVVFHMNMFDRFNRKSVEARIDEFAVYLRPLAREGDVWLYEIVDWPP